MSKPIAGNLNQVKIMWKFWRWPAMLVLLLLLAPSLLIGLRGEEALKGITWGYQFSWLFNQLFPVRIAYQDLSINLGAYDPEDKLADVPLAIDHYFISWTDYPAKKFSQQLKQTLARNRWSLVTVEPYPRTGMNKNSLLRDIVAGDYDQEIASVCQTLADSDQPVLVRWGHEMENVTGRYPWARPDAPNYIAAYQYFVDKCKTYPGERYYIWSPAGNTELSKYWPGRDYVDYIGLSVYGFPEWEQQQVGKLQSFEDVFLPKYNRVKAYERPVIIAELGITGDKQYQQQWFSKALTQASKYPLLKTLVYFNAVDSPEAWGSEFSVPDWRIKSEYFPD